MLIAFQERFVHQLIHIEDRIGHKNVFARDAGSIDDINAIAQKGILGVDLIKRAEGTRHVIGIFLARIVLADIGDRIGIGGGAIHDTVAVCLDRQCIGAVR